MRNPSTALNSRAFLRRCLFWLCILVLWSASLTPVRAVLLQKRTFPWGAGISDYASYKVTATVAACEGNKTFYVTKQQRVRNPAEGTGWGGWTYQHTWAVHLPHGETSKTFNIEEGGLLVNPFNVDVEWRYTIHESYEISASVALGTGSLLVDTEGADGSIPAPTGATARDMGLQTVSVNATAGITPFLLVVNVTTPCATPYTLFVDPGDGNPQEWAVSPGTTPTRAFTLAACETPGSIEINQRYKENSDDAEEITTMIEFASWESTEMYITLEPACTFETVEPEGPDPTNPDGPDPTDPDKGGPGNPQPPPPGTPKPPKPPKPPTPPGGTPGTPTTGGGHPVPPGVVNPALPLEYPELTDLEMDDVDYQGIVNDQDYIIQRTEQLNAEFVENMKGLFSFNPPSVGKVYVVNVTSFFGRQIRWDLRPFIDIITTVREIILWVVKLVFCMGLAREVKQAIN